MTLLINLVGPRGIHQSSDYRLTDLQARKFIEDEFGSKQVQHLSSAWDAQISFTGIASIGQRKTRDWILEVLGRSAKTEDASAAMAGLAARATVELRNIPQKDRALTIVATVRQNGRETRLFVISCVDRPGTKPLNQPLDHFEVHEVLADAPSELIFGCTRAVSKADRKYLKQLNRGTAEPAEIRRALAGINSRSAKVSRGAISEGCLVSSTMPDGVGASENFGGTAGITLDMAGSPEILNAIKEAQKGKPVFVQGQRATAKNVNELTLKPMNVSEGSTLIVKSLADSPVLFVTDSSGDTFKSLGEPLGANAIDEEAEWLKLEEGTLAGPSHRVAFSSTSGSYTFSGPSGSKYGHMEIVGLTGEAVVTKNRVTKVKLGVVSVQAFSTFEHQVEAVKTHWDISSQLTIDGAHPHGWNFTVDMVLDASGGAVSIKRNAVALRSSGSISVSCPTDSEELVVVSSNCPSVMKISKDQPAASGVIEARLFLRDIRQTTASSSSAKANRPIPKVGRNSLCPCGSGMKYEKCCLHRPKSSHS